jgi:glycosyltransferase involved in cell wall biosynthesis
MMARMDAQALATVGAVVIGRNEGERLKRCLLSLAGADELVYVDSGSNDGSPQWAEGQNAEVIELDMTSPFTAARARNCGLRKLLEIAPQIQYVQFVDGDCEVLHDWLRIAKDFLDAHADVAAVCGRRRERFPEQSVYNWLCDREWECPVGESRAFGGDVMIRADALKTVGGYREDMIAGEDPELGVRLRKAGWRIWRLGVDMTLHDAAMTHFAQWWKRILRSGYAFAHGAYLHGGLPERYCVWESRRAWLWGFWLPLGCLTVGLTIGGWAWATWLIYPAQILRQTLRNVGPLSQRATLAFYQILSRFPEAVGEMQFFSDRILGRRSKLIEYK